MQGLDFRIVLPEVLVCRPHLPVQFRRPHGILLRGLQAFFLRGLQRGQIGGFQGFQPLVRRQARRSGRLGIRHRGLRSFSLDGGNGFRQLEGQGDPLRDRRRPPRPMTLITNKSVPARTKPAPA